MKHFHTVVIDMKRRIIALVAIMGASSSALGEGVTTRDHYVIVGNGLRVQNISGQETVAFCKQFTLTVKDVRTYFRLAKPVSSRAYHHDLEMSQCRVTGYTVHSGHRGRSRWSIDRERRGLVTNAAGQTSYFYCGACTNKAFEDVYDPDAE